MHSRFAVASIFVLGFPPQGAAQSVLDAVCTALLRDGQSGLFSPVVNQERPYKAVNGEKLDFRDEARFYYVPRYNAGEEGVWHIRTQTAMLEPRGADRVFLDRPFTETRCSKKARKPLSVLSGDDRYYDLASYAEYHGPAEATDGRKWGYKYHDWLYSFHFEIEDRKGCLRTDDRWAFKKKWDVYGFEGVYPEPRREEIALRWQGAAIAQPAPKHDGLSSEFRYYDGPGPVCLSFVAPISTRSTGRATENRKPFSTSVTIQRLQGRTVTRLESKKVLWN